MSQVRSNLEIFENEISKEIERILYKPDLRKDIQFIFSVKSKKNKNEEVRFLSSVIKKTAERNKVWASLTKGDIISGDTVFNSIYVEIIEMNTKYQGFEVNKFLGSKLVKRSLNSLMKVSIYGNKYDYTSTDIINVNYNDRVELDDIDNIESEDYYFTQAEPPQISVWEEIVFPVTIIAATIAAALLFFAIRSK